jgi:hypothetical protein
MVAGDITNKKKPRCPMQNENYYQKTPEANKILQMFLKKTQKTNRDFNDEKQLASFAQCHPDNKG